MSALRTSVHSLAATNKSPDHRIATSACGDLCRVAFEIIFLLYFFINMWYNLFNYHIIQKEKQNMNVELANAERLISWIKRKINLNANSESAATRIVKRGEVYWCHFGINVGAEISKTTPRPAIIVQNYKANQKSSNTIVVPITHNSKSLPCLVPITQVVDETGNVILDGQANTSNVICVSKARLGDLITTLSGSQMKAIDTGLMTSLELMKYLNESEKKYQKLAKYSEKIKESRNLANDKLNAIRDTVLHNGFDEGSQSKIKELLDIK